MVIIKVRHTDDVHDEFFPLGSMLGIQEDWKLAQEIPDGWIEMPQGEPVPDEYPELQHLFTETFGSARFPDFRARVLPDKK